QLPPRNVKAVTDFRIQIHRAPSGWSTGFSRARPAKAGTPAGPAKSARDNSSLLLSTILHQATTAVQRTTKGRCTMPMSQPIMLCGLGRVGGKVLEFLRNAGLPVVVIDTQCQEGDPCLGGNRLIRGDCRRADVLAQAGLEQARGVLILTSDDLVNVSTALT